MGGVICFYFFGFDYAGDCETGLQFGVVDAVAAYYCDACFGHLVDSAAEDVAHCFVGNLVDREAQYGQGGERLAAHSVYVAYGVGGCDLAEGVWVVDGRCENVDGLDECHAVANVIDAGVVTGCYADQYSRVVVCGKLCQDPFQEGLVDL